MLAGLILLAACQGGTGGGSAASAAALTIEGAYAYAPPASGEVAVYFTVHNPAEAPDTLVHVNTPEAAGVMYHRNVTEGGLVRMEHLETLAVAGRDSLVLAPGGLHLMLTSVKPRSPGDTLHLALNFARAGSRMVTVVIREPGM
ncbi:MAG TPA: copper chaperone PCu(A)C [Gemmatimonadales bacterium]